MRTARIQSESKNLHFDNTAEKRLRMRVFFNIFSRQFVFDEGDQFVYFDFLYEFLNDLEQNFSDRRTK